MTTHKSLLEKDKEFSDLAEKVANGAVQEFLGNLQSDPLGDLSEDFIEEVKASLYHQVHESVHSSFKWTLQDFRLEKAKQDKIKAEQQSQKVKFEQQNSTQMHISQRRRRRNPDSFQPDQQTWEARLEERIKNQQTDEKGRRIRRTRKAS